MIVEGIDVSKYPVRIWWSDEDQRFLAEIDDLPGCMADGHTQEEALAEIRDHARMWIETAKKWGREIPLPSTDAVAA